MLPICAFSSILLELIRSISASHEALHIMHLNSFDFMYSPSLQILASLALLGMRMGSRLGRTPLSF
jgi:hypothetical protein